MLERGFNKRNLDCEQLQPINHLQSHNKIRATQKGVLKLRVGSFKSLEEQLS